jgi:hypothetical protein
MANRLPADKIDRGFALLGIARYLAAPPEIRNGPEFARWEPEGSLEP